MSSDGEGYEVGDDSMPPQQIPCLFDPSVSYASPEEAYERIRKDHGLDFKGLIAEWQLDFYGSVKLVNYVRSKSPMLGGGFADVTDDGELELFTKSGEVVATLTHSASERGSGAWQSHKWLTPTLEDDGLLTGLGGDDSDEGDADHGRPAGLVAEDLSEKMAGLSPDLYAELAAAAVTDSSFGSPLPPDLEHHSLAAVLPEPEPEIDGEEDLADAMFRDLEGHVPASPVPQQSPGAAVAQRVGLVVDHHYLEVAAKQSALATNWDPRTLITAIHAQLSAALADESPTPPPLEVVECHAADSLLSGGAEFSAKGKLHQRLTDAGFTMHCSPNKSAAKRSSGHDSAVRSGGQGATDVDVVRAASGHARMYFVLMNLHAAPSEAGLETARLSAGGLPVRPRRGFPQWRCRHQQRRRPDGSYCAGGPRLGLPPGP
jgi:hypothetical protein